MGATAGVGVLDVSVCVCLHDSLHVSSLCLHVSRHEPLSISLYVSLQFSSLRLVSFCGCVAFCLSLESSGVYAGIIVKWPGQGFCF